jgi:hypothetical protein
MAEDRKAGRPREVKTDERTGRRAHEEASGGESSQESAKKYAEGEKPTGTHGKGPAGPHSNTYEELGEKNPRDEPEE